MKIDEGARRIWPVLVEIARTKGRDISYTELAEKISSLTPILGRQLGLILSYCNEELLPPLTVLVVGKHSRLPGKGFYSLFGEDISEARKAVLDHRWSGPNPFGYAEDGTNIASLANAAVKNPQNSGDIYALVKTRGIAQQIFREAVKRIHTGCAFCGITHPTCLQAAHVIPYADASHEMRISPHNGILLCANHHLMFDRFEIAIGDDGAISCIATADKFVQSLKGK